jgi:translocation and assembly module TamB
VWAIALIVLAVAGAFAFAQTTTGKRVIADQLGKALTSPDSMVQLEGLNGLIPFDMRLEQLRMDDAEGPWLELDGFEFSWSPAALLRGRLEIDEIGARRLALLRLPPGEETEEAGPPAELPRSIPPVVIRQLEVKELELGEAVLGERAVFTLLGKLTTAQDGGVVNLTVDLERIDEDTARASLESRLDLVRIATHDAAINKSSMARSTRLRARSSGRTRR